MLTRQQVCERLNIGLTTLHKLTRSGEVRGAKIAGGWRFDPEDIEAFIEQRKAAARGETRQDAVTRAFDADDALDPVPHNPFA